MKYLIGLICASIPWLFYGVCCWIDKHPGFREWFFNNSHIVALCILSLIIFSLVSRNFPHGDER